METIQCLDSYNNDIQTYNAGGKILANCAEIAFINQGTSNVLINNALMLAPNASIGFNGNRYEFDTTPYSIIFQNTGAQVNNCVVIRKYYIKQSV
jgi:hypothetical protein